jgi:hypothetical protein
MAGSRRKEALIGGGVSLAFVLLAVIVVLHQSPDSTPTLASNTPPVGTVAPQVLGTVFTIPSPSPDPAESSTLPAVPPVQLELVTSTITALSTVFVSGKPVIQTAFTTATATQRVTLTPKAGPTVRSTRTFLATITQSGKELVTTQTAIQVQTQTQTQTQTDTQTQTVTAPGPTVTHTSIAPGPTTTIIIPGPTQTVTQTQTQTETATATVPGPTQTVTETTTCTADPISGFCP